MLKVTNGSVTLTVTMGAFKNFYAKCGFHAVDAEDGVERAEVVVTQPTPVSYHSDDSSHQESEKNYDSTEDDEYDKEEDEVDLSEIPLGEMSFDQLNEYADQLELEHDGIRSKKELRAIIREHLKK